MGSAEMVTDPVPMSEMLATFDIWFPDVTSKVESLSKCPVESAKRGMELVMELAGARTYPVANVLST